MKKIEYKQYDETHYNENSWGRYWCRYGRYYRRPKTHNERKQNYAALQDGIKVRGCRRRLPHSWDDLGYSQIYGRDWKRFTRRKHQYGPVV